MNSNTAKQIAKSARNVDPKGCAELDALEWAIAQIDRLAASGALVPVPDGALKHPRDCGMFIVDGNVFDAYGVNSVNGTMPKCPDLVQPVRLVPLAEWEGE